MESGLLRALKSIERSGKEASQAKIDMVRVYVNDAMARVSDYARQIFAAMETGDALHTQLEILTKLSQLTPINAVEAGRNVADRVIEAERFVC